MRPHMETCGRVCGMALYQELHRRLGQEGRPDIYAHQPPNLFGDAFARYFVRKSTRTLYILSLRSSVHLCITHALCRCFRAGSILTDCGVILAGVVQHDPPGSLKELQGELEVRPRHFNLTVSVALCPCC